MSDRWTMDGGSVLFDDVRFHVCTATLYLCEYPTHKIKHP